MFGGEILKTKVSGRWHFYNSIDGIRLILQLYNSKSFLHYQDHKSSRDEAFTDTNEKQYIRLKERVQVYSEI